MLTKSDMNIVLATMIAIAVGAGIGVLNAVLIVGLKINSFSGDAGHADIPARGLVFIFTGGAQILMTDAVKQANAAMKDAMFGLSPLLVFGILIAIVMMIVYPLHSVWAERCRPWAATRPRRSSWVST